MGVLEKLALFSDVNGFDIYRGWCEAKDRLGRGKLHLDDRLA